MVNLLQNIWSNPFDDSIARFFSANCGKNSYLDELFSSFSAMGQWGIIWIILGVIFLFYKSLRKIGIYSLSSIAVVGGLNEFVFKNIFARARPFVANPSEFSGGLKILYQSSSASFPSGHTLMSFTIVAILFCFYLFEFKDQKDKQKKVLPILVASCIVATLIGFSRVYLAHHYMSDVLAGLGLGLIEGTAFYFAAHYLTLLFQKYILKKKTSSPQKDDQSEPQNDISSRG
jgi:undecaprenyl-diphosphatase